MLKFILFMILFYVGWSIIKGAMDEDEGDKHLKLEMNWEGFYQHVRELDNLDEMDKYPSKFGSYYLTYYICPDCGRLLYKIKSRGTKTDFKEYVGLDVYNIFTCPRCHRFCASISTNGRPGKLSELALVSKPYSSDNEYVIKFRHTLNFINDD